MRRRFAAAAAVATLCGCAETTIDTSATEPPSATGTPTTLAVSGGAVELLPRLDRELAALSERIVENEGDDDALARVDALWAAARPDIEATRPELLAGFDGVIRLATTAVERRRPADADKARLNLTTLLAAYAG